MTSLAGSTGQDLSIWLGLRKRNPGDYGCLKAPYTSEDVCDNGVLVWTDDMEFFKYDGSYMGMCMYFSQARLNSLLFL